MRHASAVVALLFLLLAACEAEFKNESDELGAPLTISSTKLDNFIKAQVVPSEEPERYFVYFGWPRIEDEKKIRIRTDRQLALVNTDQVSFSHKTEHDQTLTYFFEVLDEANRVERSFSKTVIVPTDLVVKEGRNKLTKDAKLRVQRVFLSQTPLITNGHEVEIITDELHSQDGVITTFEEHSKANPDSAGRSGGRLTIKASQATGNLTVVMRGEHGGDGSQGPAFPSRARDGTDAGKGEYRCTGGGGRGSDREPRECSCEKFGTDATDGAPGARGNQGNPARNGGGSGILRFEVRDGREFSLKTLKFVGQAGNPGEGGDGQRGGRGGSRSGSYSDCAGREGNDGKTGAKGPPGDFAESGPEQELCIYIASEARNECL